MLLRFITSVLLAGVLVACGQGVEDSKDKINHPPTVLGVKIKTPSDAPAILGDVLKAEYQYRDLDGDAEGNSRYQWLRDDIPIPDARSIDYEITEQDINQKISFRVTPFAVSGESQGAAAESLHLLVGNDSPSAKSIQIFLNDMPVDSVKVGQVLTASYEYADLEGDAEDASAVTYQWYRNDEAIPNATDKNYQVVLVDLGKNLSVSVKPIAAEGTEEGKISMGLTQLTVINSAPVAKNLQLTSSTGNKQTVVVGTILSANFQFYDVDGDSQAGALVQWYRGDEAIPGDEARQANYKVVTQDSGKHLSFSIIPLAQMGEEIGVAVQSESVLVNNSPPSVVFNSIALSSSGGDLAKVHVGDALTVSFEFSDPDADEEGSHQYQWYKGVAAIADATSSSYLVKTEDNTQSLSVKITPKQADGVSGAVQQSASVAIVNRAPSLEALPSLVNSTSSDLAATYVGHTLTASYQGSFVDPDGDTEGESVTVWLRDGLEINNATGTSYTLKKADSGKAIAFYVKQLKDTHEGVATVGYASAEVLVKNSAPTVSDISILGTAAVSNTLTATVTIDDVDGDTAGAHLYQWKRDGANVGTQTTVNTYVLGLGDAGKNISVEVEPVDSRGNRGVGVVSTAKAVSNLSLDFNLAITTGHLKQLNLNWNSISGSNYYNVLINPDGASGFEKLAENVTDTNYLWEVSVHLTDWANASIAVEACDGSGCYVSPASTIAEFMVESIGYVKASLPQIYANFSIVSLSADGKTMAVGAPKDSIGEGITHYDGVIPSVNLAYSGGVYIYNKKPNGEWYYFAQIKGTNLSEDDYFGAPLALSADGKWLVVGAPFEDGSGSGVLNSPSDWPTDDLKSAAGAVYIFALGSNNRWEQKAYLKASNSGYDDRFGTSVSISSNGDMVVVGAIGEGSDTTGVVHKGSPWPADDNAGFSGAVYVFERDNLNNWSQQAFVKASNNKAGSDFGISVSLSGDGNALAVGS
ncbi:MAG: FG-GAP repeat protein, partial [Gammaproteobacteria bacterium]|nr:FG-GAP repeat protein [Gammaproteobacteria bacterium]